MIDFDEYDDEELASLLSAVLLETSRRQRVAEYPAAMDALLRESLADGGVEQGDAWRQPTGAHDAYPIDWVVTHVGKQWKATVGGNVWEPGVSGWAEVVPEGSYPDWVQPTGSHDAYSQGDEVQHAGQFWRSIADANVWEPGVYGWEQFVPPDGGQ